MQRIIAPAAVIAVAVLAAARALAVESDVPPWNINASDWICIQQCAPGYFGKPAEVVQTGRKFVFVNETGRRADAEWMGGGQITFTGCDNAAILSTDLRRLEFIFGSVWVR
jgi:hypothetical protein